MVIKKLNLILFCIFIVSVCLVGFIARLDASVILLPLMSMCFIFLYFVFSIYRKDLVLGVNIGSFAVGFTFLYSAVPLIGFYLGGLKFHNLSDGRLSRLDPSPIEVGTFSIYHLVYFASLTFSYIYFSKPNINLVPVTSVVISPQLQRIIFTLSGTLFLYFFISKNIFDIGFSDGYYKSLVSEGPLIVQQINGKLEPILGLLTTTLMGYIILQKSKKPFLFYSLILYLAYATISLFFYPGSRGALINLLMQFLLFWVMFHKLNVKKLILICMSILTIFLLVGFLRSTNNIAYVQDSLDKFQVIMSTTNEFQAMFGTAFHVSKLIQTLDVPSSLLLNDFTPLLPPQQLLPFQKLSAADWYVNEIGFGGTGVGFMWGVISQSIIGYGCAELVVRGILVSWFLSKIHLWYIRNRSDLIASGIYVSFCLQTIYVFRDTSGSIIWYIYWTVIPTVILLNVCRRLRIRLI